MNFVTFRLRLLWINLVNTWQQQTAYFGDSWGNLFSTVIYTASSLIFLNVVFANVRLLAGYSRDQMLFMFLLNQISFYLIMACTYINTEALVQEVNEGSFDMILAKPVPALWYSSTRRIGVLATLRDGVPAISIFLIAINWSHIHITWPLLLAGILVMLAGQLAMNAFFFALAAPVFWIGQADSLLRLAFPLTSNEIPFEGVGGAVRISLTVIIPLLIPSAMAASVMLGKSNPILTTLFAMLIAVVAVMLKIWLWQAALRNYTSASS